MGSDNVVVWSEPFQGCLMLGGSSSATVGVSSRSPTISTSAFWRANVSQNFCCGSQSEPQWASVSHCEPVWDRVSQIAHKTLQWKKFWAGVSHSEPAWVRVSHGEPVQARVSHGESVWARTNPQRNSTRHCLTPPQMDAHWKWATSERSSEVDIHMISPFSHSRNSTSFFCHLLE